jgi:hypothetical protein
MAKHWPMVAYAADRSRQTLHGMFVTAFGWRYTVEAADLVQAIVGSGLAKAVSGVTISPYDLHYKPCFESAEDERTFGNIWNAAVDEHRRRRATRDGA